MTEKPENSTQSKDAEKDNKGYPKVRMDCFFCGGKNTMVGIRAKYNGHFHGYCEKCGCKVIE